MQMLTGTGTSRRIYSEDNVSFADTIRVQIESALAHRIPSALTPPPKIIRATSPVGTTVLNELLGGGFPVSALTELVG